MVKYYLTNDEVEEELRPLDVVCIWDDNHPKPATILYGDGETITVKTTDDKIIQTDNILFKFW